MTAPPRDLSRCRSLVVTPEFLMDTRLTSASDVLALLRPHLPEDVRLVDWVYDNPRDRFTLILHSATFDPVPEGKPAPELVIDFS